MSVAICSCCCCCCPLFSSRPSYSATIAAPSSLSTGLRRRDLPRSFVLHHPEAILKEETKKYFGLCRVVVLMRGGWGTTRKMGSLRRGWEERPLFSSRKRLVSNPQLWMARSKRKKKKSANISFPFFFSCVSLCNIITPSSSSSSSWLAFFPTTTMSFDLPETRTDRLFNELFNELFNQIDILDVD